MAVVLGIDIGGSKIALGQVDREGRLLSAPLRATSDTRGEAEFLEGLLGAIEESLEAIRISGEECIGIGVGCAGTIDTARGTIVVSPNLPLIEVPLARFVHERAGLPVILDNDANVATLAEARVGAAADAHHMVMLTLGTGVGGGLFLGGELYRGATGAAAELGHTIVAAGGEQCRCGAYGCLEAYASGKALERVAARLVASGGFLATRRGEGDAKSGPAEPESAALVATASRETFSELLDLEPSRASVRVPVEGLVALSEENALTGEAIGRLALDGDPAALVAVAHVGAWLGVGVANLANIFNPELIVVGGGLSSLGDLLFVPARKVLAAAGLSPNRDVVRLVTASAGADAGVIGAGLVAWEDLA